MRRPREIKEYWPSWRYGPDGDAEIFNSADEVPDGWQKRPFEPGQVVDDIDRPEPEVLDREVIIAELLNRNIPFEYARATSYLKDLL